MTREELRRRITTVEESYEFMLAFAAQGLSGVGGDGAGVELRDYLHRSDTALTGLADMFTTLINEESLEPAERYHSFISVLDRDAKNAQAALRLVIAQPSISSQMIDNLNASIHLRALLTDLFLIDEIVRHSQETRSG